MQWEIKFYFNENSYRNDFAASTENFTGDRSGAIDWALTKIKFSNYKYFEIVRR